MGDRRLRRRESRVSSFSQGRSYLCSDCAFVQYTQLTRNIYKSSLYTHLSKLGRQLGYLESVIPCVVVCSHSPSIPTIHPLYSHRSHCVVVNKLRGFVGGVSTRSVWCGLDACNTASESRQGVGLAGVIVEIVIARATTLGLTTALWVFGEG